jgi:hypothetical protein
MSPKNSLLTVGLTALGLLGYTATRAAYPGDPSPPPGPPAASAPSPTNTVLLLSNGRILRGTVTEEGDNYIIRQNGGEIKVPKGQAEDAFGSMEALYNYKRAQVPPRDPDEHMKLARWCLSQNMQAEAKTHLLAVQALIPRSNEVKAMLVSIEAAEARAAARPRVDPALVQTGGEMPARAPGPASAAPAGDSRPAEIDVAVLKNAGKELGLTGLPVIFDLPPAIAVKRADVFARLVHPVLQASCAKCHNEQYQGKFQLVEVKKRRDLTANVFRANLDATLQLVDPENPARSEILSSALIPHGNGPNKRPIFRGSNDPRFQIISAWVNSLRAVPGPGQNRANEGVIETRFGPKPSSGGGGFATERGSGQGPLPLPMLPGASSRPEIHPVNADPGVSFIPGSSPNAGLLGEDKASTARGSSPQYRIGNKTGRFVAEEGPSSQDDFPAPYMLGGPKPKLTTGAPQPTAKLPAPAGSASAPAPVDPQAVKASATTTPKKPVKIDPALLEKALLNRNGAGR